MWARNKNKGYTIIEVMIFLAVSGFMFVIAATAISGKQSSAEFKQSLNDLNTQVQQVVNDVANGFYPSGGNFTCTVQPSGNPRIVPGSAGQGTNEGCVFLGKAMQFQVGGDNTAYDVYSLAGRQYDGTQSNQIPVEQFGDSQPVAIYDLRNNPPQFDLTDKNTVQWGLQVTKVVDVSHPGTAVDAIGFFGSFGKYSGSGNLISGSQNITVAVIPKNPSYNGSQSPQYNEANYFQSLGSGWNNFVQNNPNVLICLSDGGSRQGAVMVGGGNGQRITTTLLYSKPAQCP